MPSRRVALLLFAVLLSGCSRAPGLFSDTHARAHLSMLAGTIGSRPSGSEANARARAYIVDQLRLFGYTVRVQETDARRPELGRTARVANIIAVLPGTRQEAVGLLSHYDSRSDTPGAGDDAFGVAVSLEAARVHAARQDRQWSTLVLVTDAEEAGLMGAAALMDDVEVRDRLFAYLNIEATGSAGPLMLFETGPANEWLVDAWAASAPRPRGGSFGLEIYRRLPNDTDFSILRRFEIPGLNFALVGDSYSYHTIRDIPDRVPTRAIRNAGDTVVATLAELQTRDITARTAGEPTYFDIGGTVAMSYGPFWSNALAVVAILLGLLAWFRVTRYLVRVEGLGAWAFTFVWAVLGFLLAAGAMVAVTAAMRLVREVYHPWYAHAGRFFLLLASTGAAVAWMTTRAGRWIPSRAKGLRHPVVAWTCALPPWIALALAAWWTAPAAAYLWTLPLLAAGLGLLLVPINRPAAVRAASVLALAVAGTLWLRDTMELLEFMVAIFGRLPVVTPVFAYAALLALAGLMVLPPLFAASASLRPLMRPSLVTAVLLAVVAITAIASWLAPAYTNERPLRATMRAIQEPGVPASTWVMAANEPGVELGAGAPEGWTPSEPEVRSLPWGRLPHPFVFGTSAAPFGAPPVSINGFTITPAEGGHTLMISVLPAAEGLSISFVLPAGMAPVRSNLPGAVRQGRWIASYFAPPKEGVAWQASFNGTDPAPLRQARVAVTSGVLPGSVPEDRLPAWLPRERIVWTTSATWVLDPAGAPLEPVPPLR